MNANPMEPTAVPPSDPGHPTTTHDDVEALRRELASTQAHLQAVIEELQAANEELRVQYEELNALNETLTNIQDSIQTGLIVVDRQGRARLFNPLAGQILGLLPDDIGQPLLDTPCALKLPNLGYWLGVVIRDGVPVLQPIRLDRRHYLMQIAPYLERDGQHSGAVLSLADVSELHQAEARYQLLYDTMLQGVVHQDANGQILAMNPAAQRILGRGPEDFLGQTSEDQEHLTLREDGSPFPGQEHPSMVALRTGQELRGVVMGIHNPREGAHRWIRIDAIPLFREGESDPYQVYTLFDDITDRRRDDARLRYQALLLREAGELTHLGAWEFDPDTLEGTWTEETARIHELGPNAPVTVALGLSFYPGESGARIAAATQAAIQEGTPYDLELEFVSAQGTPKWVRVIGHPVMKDGRVIRVRGSIQDITARKRTETALQDSEARLRLFIEHAPAALAMLDRDMRYLAISRRWLRDYGLGEREVIGLSHYEVFPDIPARWKAVHRRGLAGEVVRAEADRFERADGSVQWVSWEVRPWYDAQGQVGGIGIFTEDITARKRAELELERFRQIVDTSSEKLLFVDRALRYQVVNPAYAALFGLKPEDLRGRRLEELLDPSAYALVASHLEAALAGEPQRFSLRAPYPGRTLYLEVEQVPFRAEGRVEGVVVSLHDVTEARLARDALENYQARLEDLVLERTAQLQEAEAQARLLLDASADGLYGVDLQGRVTFINPAACQLLGHAARDLLGRSMHALIHHTRPDGRPYPEADCPMGATLRDGLPTRVDQDLFWRADGQPIPVSYASRPMLRDGQIVGAVVSFVDMTAQRAAAEAREAALAAAERLARARSEFIANMSHEIRTPLNAVMGLAQVGMLEYPEHPSREDFAHILEAARLLLGIVDQILDFSRLDAGELRLEAGRLSPARVIDQVATVIVPQARAKGLAFQVEKAPDLPEYCQGDASRLSQVLMNLLGNAVKFTAQGQVGLSAWRDGDRLCLRVTDTGIGMDAAQLARIFAPFEQADGSNTRRFGGTGLGLSISQHLVQLMGGAIRASSQPGVGSQFEVRLPLVETSAPPAPTPTATAGPGLAGLSILAAEDNEVNRLVLQDLLESQGARVTCVENGQLAVERIQAAGPNAYDLVLMDIQMPELDGYAATRRILAQFPDLPIIGLTAHALPEERAQCLAVGMRAHVAKPIELDTLARAILDGLPARPRPAPPAPAPAPEPTPPPLAAQGPTPGETPEPPTPTTWVDWPALEGRYGHKPAFLTRLLDTVLASNADAPTKLRAAAAAGDNPQLAFLTHGLKGMSGNLMAWGLQERAKTAERAARDNQPEAIPQAEALADALEALLTEVRERLGSP